MCEMKNEKQVLWVNEKEHIVSFHFVANWTELDFLDQESLFDYVLVLQKESYKFQ